MTPFWIGMMIGMCLSLALLGCAVVVCAPPRVTEREERDHWRKMADLKEE